MRPLTAIFAAAAIALPWYWAVGLATEGEFLRRFFWTDNVMRATGVAMEGHQRQHPVLSGRDPGRVFPLVAVCSAAGDRPGAAVAAARWDSIPAMCWRPAGSAFMSSLFSLARTKLPSYVTPCYPALALLVGQLCRSLEPRGDRRRGPLAVGGVRRPGAAGGRDSRSRFRSSRRSTCPAKNGWA